MDMRAEGEVEGEDDDDEYDEEEDEGEKEVDGEQEEEEEEYGYEGDEEERRRWGGRNMEGPISSPVPGLPRHCVVCHWLKLFWRVVRDSREEGALGIAVDDARVGRRPWNIGAYTVPSIGHAGWPCPLARGGWRNGRGRLCDRSHPCRLFDFPNV